MKIAKNKTMAIAMVLMFAFSAVAMIIPAVSAQKITVEADVGYYGIIGVNSPTEISWTFFPANLNPLYSDAYKDQTMIWANATITLTRPDNTTDVINGPIEARTGHQVQGREQRTDIVLIYTPNMMGTWTTNLYWPGDDTYNEINQTSTFEVGPHFDKRETWAMLSMRPYPNVGLGQPILINAWVTPPPMFQRDYYEDYLFTFTSPSGTSFTVGPMDSELPGTVWFDLPLTELGNWTIKFEFPGDHAQLGCSVTRTITVQQEWIPTYPDTPLPTEPWSFPINTENREWRNIAGPWDQIHYNATEGAWNPYTEAPRTAHVLWKLGSDGQLGGYIGSPHSIETGGGQAEYEPGDAGLFTSSPPNIRTVMAGRGYYNSRGMIHCVDMQTGEELWAVSGSFDVGSRRGQSAVLYDFTPRFIAYDAITGAKILDVEGPPSFSYRYYADPIVYGLQTNSSRVKGAQRVIAWTTDGTSNNFASRVLWNISDTSQRGMQGFFGGIIDGLWVNLDIYIDTYFGDNTMSLLTSTMIAINATTGEIVYNKPIHNVADVDSWMFRQGPCTGFGYGLLYTAFTAVPNEARGWAAIDVQTGNIKWFSEMADYPWGNFWAYMPEACGYNMIYAVGYNGVWAFNVTNGDIVWHYIADDQYQETPYDSNIVGSDAYPNNLNLTEGDSYASYSFGSVGPVIGGGIVFAPNTEHSPTFLYRGIQLHAIDAFTGDKVWSILGYYSPTAIAYGTLLAQDTYNGFTYAFGKGETETTVAPSSKVIAKGDSILLEGTVLDMSPAQKGTAAVSDADQTAWMEYLHMQQPYPVSATGVSVSLDALDPNNNYVHLGDTTTDLTGKYSFLWEPDIEGKYTIVASFANSEAYYGSTAETAIGVTEVAAAATAEPTPTPATAPLTDPYILSIGIAAIVAIVVIGVVLILMLRKR